MTNQWRDAGLVIRIGAFLADRRWGTPEEPNPERDRMVGNVPQADTDVWHLEFGALDADTRRMIRQLLDAADEFGTDLRLSLAVPEYNYRGPRLGRPVIPNGPTENGLPHGYVDPTAVSTLLIVDAQFVPGGPSYHWWIAAEPATGSHPDPAAAVAALRAVPDDFDPFTRASGDAAMAFYGQQKATVRGFWRGRWVQAEFSRNDSGEEHRWQVLRDLLEPTFARDQ